MRKIGISIILLLIFTFLIGIGYVDANMAAPMPDLYATTITFAKNEDIAVTSEVLDIRMENDLADITATYVMKNKQDYEVSTPSMFISPNISGSSISVVQDGNSLEYQTEIYSISYLDGLDLEDWQFVILDKELDEYGFKVQTINFDLDFKANEEAEIVVNYKYALGGYPSRTDNNKRGSLTYYLTPAAMWEDFDNLTINLYLDDNMPVLKSANLDFEKISSKHYRYESTSLPNENLEIEIGLNAWQKFIGYFNSPYLIMNLLMLLPFIIIGLIILVVVIVIVVYYVKKKKKSKKIVEKNKENS